MRRQLICDCGNRDEDDVEAITAPLPRCSADCGRTMRVAHPSSDANAEYTKEMQQVTEGDSEFEDFSE